MVGISGFLIPLLIAAIAFFALVRNAERME